MNYCGVNPTMSAFIGEVTESEDTTAVTVENVGTPSNGNFKFDFTLQKGIKGDPGAQGVGIQSISIEEVNNG